MLYLLHFLNLSLSGIMMCITNPGETLALAMQVVLMNALVWLKTLSPHPFHHFCRGYFCKQFFFFGKYVMHVIFHTERNTS